MGDYDAETIETEPSKGDGLTDSIANTNISSIFWGQKLINERGQFQVKASFPSHVIVNAASQVAVSITELNQEGNPHLGNANLSILNVVPKADGTISVRGHVHFSSPLRCMLNFIIVN